VRLTVSELPWPLRASEVIPQLERLPGVSAVRAESKAEEELIIVELTHVAYAGGLWNSLCEGPVIGRAFEVELRVNDGGRATVVSLDRALESFLELRRAVAKAEVARQLTEMRERAHVLEGLAVAIDSLELLTLVLRDCDPAESVWRLMHLASPALRSRAPCEPVSPETLRAAARHGLRREHQLESELFDETHSYDPGFSEAQAIEITQVVGGPPAIVRSRLVQESLELVRRYEKLRSGPGWRKAVHERVRGQLERLRTRYRPARHTMDANRARSRIERW
jgi:DNA gyrase subunit A